MNDARRDSSYGRRHSFSGPAGMGLPTLNMNVTIKDPRPIKDKAFRGNLVHSLLAFLGQSGYPHPISTKTFTNPTTKEFQDVFKFLYLKLEPYYEFQKNLSDDIPVLLKTMRYPAPESISKTSLYSIGALHSWPQMLALLGWMMDNILIMEKFREILDGPQTGSLRERDLDPKLDMTIFQPDDVLYHYLTRMYRVWMLTGSMNDQDLENQMTLSFQRRKDQLEDDANKLAEMNEGIRNELDAAKSEVSPLVALEREQQILRSDTKKFQDAISHGEPRIGEVRRANEELRKDITSSQAKLADIERAKIEVQEILRKQTTTREGLESKLEERNRLQRRADNLKKHLQGFEQELRSLGERYQQSENETETLSGQYRDLAVKIGIIPETAKYAGGENYDLRLGHDGTPSRLSIDLRTNAERAISSLRAEFTRTVNEIGSELTELEGRLESLKEQVEDRGSQLNAKKNQYRILERRYQEEREVAKTDHNNRQAFMESQQDIIEAMTQEISQNNADAEKLEQENILLERQAAHNREIYTRQIKDMLEQMKAAKLHVEQQVMGMQAVASRELEDTRQQQKDFIEAYYELES